MHYDVFNGDADGIIALLQLRLSEPKESRLITGVKRDIKLLGRVLKQDDVSSVTVLDISMEKNTDPLNKLLENNTPVFYCDHHRTGDIPQSKYLETLIDLDAEACTSLLVNEKLSGKHLAWAIAAAFGDNLISTAKKIATSNGFKEDDINFLCELGTLINYNGYGADESDLHMSPVELFKNLLNYPDPFMLRQDLESPFYMLKNGYEADYAKLAELVPIEVNHVCKIYELPAES